MGKSYLSQGKTYSYIVVVPFVYIAEGGAPAGGRQWARVICHRERLIHILWWFLLFTLLREVHQQGVDSGQELIATESELFVKILFFYVLPFY